MSRITILIASDWGPHIHQAARALGTVAALLITLALVAGEGCYDLGRQLRQAIDQRNDQLAAWWVALLGLRQIEPAPPVPPAPAGAAAAPTPALRLLPAAAPVLLLPPAVEVAAVRAPRKRKASAPAAKGAAAPRKRSRKVAVAA